MWVIAGGILASLVTTLIVAGLEGVPGEWIGVAVALLFAGIAFALGNYE